MKHPFTAFILRVLHDQFGDLSNDIYQASDLIQYINEKTRSADKGSKSRGSFANIYAIYVLAEDYLKQEETQKGGYSKYAGAMFRDLMVRQRELPFGSKLQNHALNHRLNQEFKRIRPTCELSPILRDVESKRYWINETLLLVSVGSEIVNIGLAIIAIIDSYIAVKKDSFTRFIEDCKAIRQFSKSDPNQVQQFVSSLVDMKADARIFEIVSYAILKTHYADKIMFWGWSKDAIDNEDSLVLYKTGRCNANDGGIDFVMKPLGRFFQVTETTDVHKYFLDIDKTLKYPITFVVKSKASSGKIREEIRQQASDHYPIVTILEKYMSCVEEIINIDTLLKYLATAIGEGKTQQIIEDIVTQSQVEFDIE